MPTTACLLIIGNEILSGRTQDANIRFLAQSLGSLGLRLEEIRVIPDMHARIVDTVSECRARYGHVFTTGGIGPTHDDITAACVAEAFGVPLLVHQPTFTQLEAHFPPGEFNTARQRMAMLPEGATPIANSISIAPGFTIGNVHVMAGVPKIMRAMFHALTPTLPASAPLVSRAWHSDALREGDIAEALETIQQDFPTLDLGSYPYYRENDRRGVALVAKGYDAEQVGKAADRIEALITKMGITPVFGEPT